MKQLIHPEDPAKMNWIEGNTPWGTVKCPDGLSCTYESEKKGDAVFERFTFRNETDHDLFTALTDVAVYTPFNDNYEEAAVCMEQRCHTHIWCADEVSYVMALRVGGKGPHLGLC